MIAASLPELLRPGYAVDDPRRLPFVRDFPSAGHKRRTERNFWAPEFAFPGFAPSEVGTLCACAYLLQQKENGRSAGHLTIIMRAMPTAHMTSCEIAFLAVLENCTSSAAKLTSPQSLGRYALACMERDRLILEASGEPVALLAQALGVTVRELGGAPC